MDPDLSETNLIKSRKHGIKTLSGSVSPPPARRQKLDSSRVQSALLNSKDTRVELDSKEKDPNKEKRAFELISWNVNGIRRLLPKERTITSYFKTSTKGRGENSRIEETPPGSGDELQDQKLSSLRAFLKRHEFPEIVCLQEIHISPKEHDSMLKVVQKVVNQENPTYEIYFSLPRDKFNAKGFGGRVHGVCTFVRVDLSQRFNVGIETRAVEWDLEGRVLVTELTSKQTSEKFVVVNGYWPNGTEYAYRDPETGAIIGTRHEFKRKFHEKILDMARHYKANDWCILLIGDMNIAPQRIDGFPNLRLGSEHIKNRADFNSKFLDERNEDGLNGVDTFRAMNGEKRAYSYHGEKVEEWGRTCDRVDLGIVNQGLVKRGALMSAQIWESIEERDGSDHVPIGVRIDLQKLFLGGE